MIEIRTIGGYGEVGKNMTAVRVDDEVVIFDMGLHLPNYIRFTEEEGENVVKLGKKALMKVEAIPNDEIINDWTKMVKAIIPSHAHLDHVGAIPYMSSKYNCPVICTPFTANVLRRILKDEKIKIRNQIKILNPNAELKLTKNLKIEFINMTHSTPQTVMIALHTKYGIVLYCNDFKLDNNPTLGRKPNYDALQNAGKKGVLVAIIDSLYCDRRIKTPSELVAKEMLKDVLLGVHSRGHAVIVSTFSSHIARLKSIAQYAKQLNRKVVFLGRSLSKYITAAKDAKVIDLAKEGEICSFAKHIKRKLTQIEKKGAHKFLIIATGHQGEPKSVLSKMSKRVFPFHFSTEDHVVFSCKTIPTSINEELRAVLEKDLKGMGVRIFKDIHVSGHGGYEDIRDLLRMTSPKHVIPAHAENKGVDAFVELAREMGYSRKFIHPFKNGEKLIL
ncbi:RNase J family beta-CASP ribonuclease [Candidatus Woesearchaeota archaeon]|nr:RNase J family beta-CASP ribonuclease [Candidatus Woesearchaeota archaeon]